MGGGEKGGGYNGRPLEGFIHNVPPRIAKWHPRTRKSRSDQATSTHRVGLTRPFWRGKTPLGGVVSGGGGGGGSYSVISLGKAKMHTHIPYTPLSLEKKGRKGGLSMRKVHCLLFSSPKRVFGGQEEDHQSSKRRFVWPEKGWLAL